MSAAATFWAWRQTACNPAAKLVLLSLAHYADDDNCAWPSKSTIATETGLSLATVKRAAAWLIENGYMDDKGQRETYKNKDGRRHETVVYCLSVEAFATDRANPKKPDSTRFTMNPVHHEPGSNRDSTRFTMNPNTTNNTTNLFIYAPASISVELPPEIPHEIFERFIAHRLEIKKTKRAPINQRVAENAIKTMLRIVRNGFDLTAAIEQMEIAGWYIPFEPKNAGQIKPEATRPAQSEKPRTAAQQMASDRQRAINRANRGNQSGDAIDGEFTII